MQELWGGDNTCVLLIVNNSTVLTFYLKYKNPENLSKFPHHEMYTEPTSQK